MQSSDTPTPQPESGKQVQINYEALQNEVEILKANVQKRKREITTLKIMFYVSVILVMLGFFYSSNSLQKAQIHSIDDRIHRLETNQRQNLIAMQEKMDLKILNLQASVKTMEGQLGLHTSRNLQQAVSDLNTSLDKLETDSPMTRELVQQVQDSSRQFLESYQEAQAEARVLP